jgi:hypothetical protein
MSSREAALLVLMVLGLWQGWRDWRLRPVHPPDGVLAPEEPQQVDIATDARAVHGRWTLTPRARYDITARILGREDYTFDGLSDLAPEDLALGWGAMSDNRIVSSFKFVQGSRFLTWHPLSEPPIPWNQVIVHSANTHVIPANRHVRSQLASLRVGQVVHLTGLLVDGISSGGGDFHTSLSREDTGPGACEVMLVESVEVQ